MEQASPTGQTGPSDQQKNVDEERKKLDEDLKAGRISQAEYFKKTQELGGGVPGNPGTPVGVAPAQAQAPVPAGAPQLPPIGGMPVPQMPGQAPVSPISPVTPAQPGPQEEVPPIGQALAVGSEDIEVVECYKCSGLITVTTKQRPVIIACPTCGTKGEVDATEVEMPKEVAAPKATDGLEYDEKKVFKFAGEEHVKMPSGPTFGSSLDEDLADQEVLPRPAPTPAPAPATTPANPNKPQVKKTETE